MRFHFTLICTALAFIGCGKSTTETSLELHPAQGTLLMNGQPAKEGSVQFLPDPTQDLIVNGQVDAAGRFELYTLANGKRQKGAPAGNYSVMYTAATTEHTTHPSINTTAVFTIEPGKTNEWTIELAEKK